MKLNKKQTTAISNLKYDIDELDNKPRRLFDSLRGFAEAFLEDDEEHLNEVIDSINQYEDYYYLFYSVPEIMKEIGVSARETKRELLSVSKNEDMSDDEFSYYSDGVNNACNEMVKKIINNLAEFNK
jgi:hypothetical protein